MKKNAVYLTISLILIIDIMPMAADQPQSTINMDGDQYSVFDSTDKTDGELDYSTSETPTPNCPGDTTDGDLDYFWDFGSLDADDNGDGTATIYTDQQAAYQVTVYCEQDFIDGSGSEYTEDTQVSQ